MQNSLSFYYQRRKKIECKLTPDQRLYVAQGYRGLIALDSSTYQYIATSGLATCCALFIYSQDSNLAYLAHIDERHDLTAIITDIERRIDIKSKKNRVNIYYSPNTASCKLVMQIKSQLGDASIAVYEVLSDVAFSLGDGKLTKYREYNVGHNNDTKCAQQALAPLLEISWAYKANTMRSMTP